MAFIEERKHRVWSRIKGPRLQRGSAFAVRVCVRNEGLRSQRGSVLVDGIEMRLAYSGCWTSV